MKKSTTKNKIEQHKIDMPLSIKIAACVASVALVIVLWVLLSGQGFFVKKISTAELQAKQKDLALQVCPKVVANQSYMILEGNPALIVENFEISSQAAEEQGYWGCKWKVSWSELQSEGRVQKSKEYSASLLQSDGGSFYPALETTMLTQFSSNNQHLPNLFEAISKDGNNQKWLIHSSLLLDIVMNGDRVH